MARILIVEDNKNNRYMLEAVLQAEGHQVVAARQGEEALSLARQNPVDIVISDILMPVMNGFRLCREMKSDQRLKRIPFVFYSATFLEEEDEALAKSLGASRFLVKPVGNAPFINMLNQVLDEHSKGLLPTPEPSLSDESILDMYEDSLTRKLTETVENLRIERQALRKSEQQLKEAQEIARVGHWELDLQAGALHWSDEMYRLLGCLPQEFKADSEVFLKNIYPADRDMVERTYRDSQAKQLPYAIDYRLKLEDGTVKHVHERGQTQYNESGQPVYASGTIQDITERKQAEQALTETRNILQAAMDQSPAGIVIFEAREGRLRYINDAGLLILGCDRESLHHALSYDQFVANWERMDLNGRPLSSDEMPLTRALKFGETCNREYVVCEPQGDSHVVSANAAPVRDDYGNIIAAIVMFTDISEGKRHEEERNKLQQQLQQVQKIESIGQLAGGVAHDFNNMLGVILGHAELALIKSSPPSPLISDLEEILAAAKRSAELTRQLLTFARKQVIDPKVLDLNDTVTGMLKMLQRLIGENVQLSWIPAPELWQVKVDPSQVDQILANLCVNARDAISGIGNITIKTRNCVLDESYTSIHPYVVPGEYVQLSMSDDGHGMDREVQAHIFEPFFTTKEEGKGTGLGLATVFGAVKQNNGFVTFYSEPELGTVFNIYFPRVEKSVDVLSETAEMQAPCGTETVLLVEDDEMLLSLETAMLEEGGYKVLVAATTAQAETLAREHPGPIHLLISDMIMPVMNGKELSDRLQLLRPDMKVLLMSGYSADIISKQGVIEEGIHFLQKPVSFATLMTKVREVLDAR